MVRRRLRILRKCLTFFVTLAERASAPAAAEVLAKLDDLREDLRGLQENVRGLQEKIAVIDDLREEVRVVREEVMVAVTYKRLDVWDFASSKSGSECRTPDFRENVINYYQRQGISLLLWLIVACMHGLYCQFVIHMNILAHQ
jgi:hypothetical protein